MHVLVLKLSEQNYHVRLIFSSSKLPRLSEANCVFRCTTTLTDTKDYLNRICELLNSCSAQRNQGSLVGVVTVQGAGQLRNLHSPTGLPGVKTVTFTLIMCENVRTLQIRRTSMLMLS